MSQFIKKKLPALKEGLQKAVDPSSQTDLISKGEEIEALLSQLDQAGDKIQLEEYLVGRIKKTEEILAQAEQTGATPEEIQFAQTVLIVDKICLKQTEVIDAMVQANEQLGQAAFSYASAMDLDEQFDIIEEKYGEEIAEKTYELSVKENISIEEALKKIVQDKAGEQITPNEQKHQENKNPASSYTSNGGAENLHLLKQQGE